MKVEDLTGDLEVRGRLVSLRLLGPQDAPDLQALHERNARLFGAVMPDAGARPATEAEWRLALHTARTLAAEDRRYYLGIFRQGRLVGDAGLFNVVRQGVDSATLGYNVDAACSGRGYATDAVGLALELAFGRLGLHRVEAAVLPRNRASLRVLEKNGFRREGLLRGYLRIRGVWEDHLLMALTAEEHARARGGEPAG